MKDVPLTLSPQMLHFLKQQRTEYKTLSAETAAFAYARDMERIFDHMRGFLPKSADSVLDVGGGLGGMALRLSQHYGEATKVIVYDRDGDEGSKVGWHEKAEEFGPYNSLALTEEFLKMRGCTRLEVVNADLEPLSAGPHNVVVSLLSMGFHYPVSAYLNQIYAALAPGGVLMFDVRRGTSEELEATRVFGHCAELYEGEKHRLMGFRK